MKRFDRFERNLPELMADLASARVPDYFDDLLQATARTRQRPAWRSLERWLPLDTTFPALAGRGRSLRYLAILALVGLIVAAAVIAYVGTRPNRLPAPFGPAANGSLYFALPNGDIGTADAVSGSQRSTLNGLKGYGTPAPSRDGQHLLFVRTVPGGQQVLVTDADGTNSRPLGGTYSNLTDIDSSPTDAQVAIVSTVAGAGAITVLPADGSAPHALSLGLAVQNLWYLPDGRLVFIGTGTAAGAPTYGLYVVNADGTGLRPIEPPTAGGSDWVAMSPSPDGLSLVYHRWIDPGETGRLHIVDIATGTDTPVQIAGTVDGEHHEAPLVSPDGKRLLFKRYAADSGDVRLAVVPIAGGVAVSIGPAVPFDVSPDAGFSPDGRMVIAYYPSLAQLWLLDPTGSQARDRLLSLPVSETPTWQRIAP